MVTSGSTTRAAGSQTLARGLQALELIASSAAGLTIQEVADELGVHRSIATRLLATVAEYRLIARGPDGRYRGAGGLAALARGLYSGMREVAGPIMRHLADEIGTSVALFVEESSDAVAILVAEPSTGPVRVAYREGARHPLDRGAAGYALLAAGPPRPGEDPHVTVAREAGQATSFGEILTGYWGLGVPLRISGQPAACLTLISVSEAVVRSSVEATVSAADQLMRALA